jgi:hypothetical protein
MPTGINNAGQIAGSYSPGPGIPQRGFLDDHGQVTTFYVPQGRGAFVQGLNGQGEVVGYGSGPASHANGFFGDPGNFTTVNFPGSFRTEAYGANNSGQVVGNYTLPASSGFAHHSFVYKNGQFSDIAVPNASPQDINNRGQIVGSYSDGTHNHGFIQMASGRMIGLDIPGARDTFILGDNNLGQVVGSYTDQLGHTHGFLDAGGRFATIDKPGATSTRIEDINNQGDIVGSYTDGSGSHGFLAHLRDGSVADILNSARGHDDLRHDLMPTGPLQSNVNVMSTQSNVNVGVASDTTHAPATVSGVYQVNSTAPYAVVQS